MKITQWTTDAEKDLERTVLDVSEDMPRDLAKVNRWPAEFAPRLVKWPAKGKWSEELASVPLVISCLVDATFTSPIGTDEPLLLRYVWEWNQGEAPTMKGYAPFVQSRHYAHRGPTPPGTPTGHRLCPRNRRREWGHTKRLGNVLTKAIEERGRKEWLRVVFAKLAELVTDSAEATREEVAAACKEVLGC